MGCGNIVTERIKILGLAFFFQGILDALIEFSEDKKHPELESRMQRGVDFIVQVGQDFEPSFGALAKGKSEPYVYYDIFHRIVRGSIYQEKLAEVRRKFLSIIDEGVELENRKHNAEFCIEFLFKAVNVCLHEHSNYVPATPRVILDLCARK